MVTTDLVCISSYSYVKSKQTRIISIKNFKGFRNVEDLPHYVQQTDATLQSGPEFTPWDLGLLILEEYNVSK